MVRTGRARSKIRHFLKNMEQEESRAVGEKMLSQALRAEGNNVTFGFVTSEGSGAMRQQASDSGALFLIAKPFTADMFAEALKPLFP